MISSKHPTGAPPNFLTRKNGGHTDNAMLDYQASCWWHNIYVDGIVKNLATLFQLVISIPSIMCPPSKKCPSFSLEFKISEEIRCRKNNAKYKGKQSRRAKTWWELTDIHHFKGTLLFHTVTNKPSANPGQNPNVTKEWDTRKSHFSLHLYND